MLRRGAELEDRIEMLAGYTRPAEAGLRPEHPGPHLEIVAELGTADDAAGAVRADIAGPEIEPIGIAPCPAEMAAEIKPAPVPDRQLSIGGGRPKQP